MKSKKALFITGGISILTIGLTIGFTQFKKSISFVAANEPEYELLCNNTSRIINTTTSYTEEVDASISTIYDNKVAIKASNVIKYNDGWQTINPHGYFYNPVSELGNNNKISGIKSIRYTSDTSNSLSLYYGYSINNTEIIYSLEDTLNSGVEYTFTEHHPYYIYIQNNSGTPININALSIKYSCTAEPYPYQNLNVLMIGNSFADDTLYYAARIAQSYGININLYDSYIASCTIDKHYNNLLNDKADYSMRSMNGDTWVYNDSKTLDYIIKDKHWDIISFQQASAEVGRSSSYSNLSNLVNEVIDRIGYTPKLLWHQTWAYESTYHEYQDYFSYFNNDPIQMYNAIVSCYQSQVVPLGIFDGLIPAGTAVQNMRSSYMKETINRDGKHMSSVHGRFLLGLDFLSSVYGIDLYKSPCTYIPYDISPSFMNVAHESVQNAVKTPLAITNSVYTSHEIAEYDLTNYTEIDAGLVGCSYWDANSADKYNIRLQNESGKSNQYVSTSRFTPSTLPVGSIIAVDEAFGVSLQTWVSDNQQVDVMNDTYENIIEVDNSFWDGYAYRAFNIFKCGHAALSGQYVDEQYDQIFDGFHIYVPNASLGDLQPKTYNSSYSADKNIFINQGYNIDAFERIHLDPITGFYKCDSYYYLMNSYVDDTAQKFICTRPFYNGDLPENTIIVLDSGYQYRSDCWKEKGTTTRPGNVSSAFTVLGNSFWEGYRNRTFNVSSTSSAYVGQNALAFMNHMRLYVPVSDDIYIEKEDTATMTALGYATLNSTGASFYGKENIPVLVTLHGDDVNKVTVRADGVDIGATKYTYSRNTGAISITTTGSASGLTYGNINGTLNRDAGTISNVSLTGSISSYVANNGSITISETYFDRCNYSTNAASQEVWQRSYWYRSAGAWQYNSGSGEWTTSSSSYKLDNNYSMGLRIANYETYWKTRFFLKNDLNNGEGISAHGVSIWIYNPNGDIYNSFRVYLYTAPSASAGGHLVPDEYSNVETISRTSLESNQWLHFETGISTQTIYNISIYFETTSNSTTYVYLGHLSIY